MRLLLSIEVTGGEYKNFCKLIIISYTTLYNIIIYTIQQQHVSRHMPHRNAF
jgi:hypothetical protein